MTRALLSQRPGAPQEFSWALMPDNIIPYVNEPGIERKGMYSDNILPDSKTQSALMEMWRETCRGGGSVSFKILSASMRPTIEVGDTVRVGRVEPSGVRVGDILAFQDGQNVVVHRIIDKNWSDRELRFRHRGDAGGLSGIIGAQHLIGKVLAVKRKEREISLDTPWFTISNRVLGWRLHFIDTLGHLPAGLPRIIIHQTIRLPWKLCHSIFLRPFIGKKS